MYELEKLLEAYKRKLQTKAQYNYVLALNITNNLGMLFDSKCKLLPIEKYYPIFNKKEVTEEQFALKMETLYKNFKNN